MQGDAHAVDLTVAPTGAAEQTMDFVKVSIVRSPKHGKNGCICLLKVGVAVTIVV